MGILIRKSEISAWIRKYRWPLAVLGVGLILLSLPSGSREPPPDPPRTADSSLTMEQRLENILEKISGAGRVSVLLTQSRGERIYYQEDRDLSENAEKTNTVLLTKENREQTGMIRQVDSPGYRGAVIVCQGGDDPKIKLAIVRAVSNATGLGADRITVLKMK